MRWEADEKDMRTSVVYTYPSDFTIAVNETMEWLTNLCVQE